VVAVLIDHLHPRTAPHGKGRLAPEIGEVLIPSQEIAEALGVPERAVQSVITSGKSRLLSALNQG
jgi:hypothetical protein